MPKSRLDGLHKMQCIRLICITCIKPILSTACCKPNYSSLNMALEIDLFSPQKWFLQEGDEVIVGDPPVGLDQVDELLGQITLAGNRKQ